MALLQRKQYGGSGILKPVSTGQTGLTQGVGQTGGIIKPVTNIPSGPTGGGYQVAPIINTPPPGLTSGPTGGGSQGGGLGTTAGDTVLSGGTSGGSGGGPGTNPPPNTGGNTVQGYDPGPGIFGGNVPGRVWDALQSMPGDTAQWLFNNPYTMDLGGGYIDPAQRNRWQTAINTFDPNAYGSSLNPYQQMWGQYGPAGPRYFGLEGGGYNLNPSQPMNQWQMPTNTTNQSMYNNMYGGMIRPTQSGGNPPGSTSMGPLAQQPVSSYDEYLSVRNARDAEIMQRGGALPQDMPMTREQFEANRNMTPQQFQAKNQAKFANQGRVPSVADRLSFGNRLATGTNLTPQAIQPQAAPQPIQPLVTDQQYQNYVSQAKKQQAGSNALNMSISDFKRQEGRAPNPSEAARITGNKGYLNQDQWAAQERERQIGQGIEQNMMAQEAQLGRPLTEFERMLARGGNYGG